MENCETLKANPSNPYAYLLVRTDLESLGRGKGYAHSMHAGNHMTWQTVVKPLLANQKPDELVMAWHQSAEGFGTTAAIGTRDQVDINTLQAVVEAAKSLGHEAGIVEDPTYPYEVSTEIYHLLPESLHTAPADRIASGFRCYRREISCAWVFGEKEELKVLLSRFGLVPND